MVTRLPLDGLEITCFVTGDDTRYWHNVGTNRFLSVDSEDVFLGSAQIKKYFRSDWSAGIELRESYIDQVQYVLTPDSLLPAVVKGNVLEARHLFAGTSEATGGALEFQATRELFRSPLDDSWKYGPRAVLGYNTGTARKRR